MSEIKKREFHEPGSPHYEEFNVFPYRVFTRLDFSEPITGEYAYATLEEAISFGKYMCENGYVVEVVQEIAFNTN